MTPSASEQLDTELNKEDTVKKVLLSCQPGNKQNSTNQDMPVKQTNCRKRL